MKFYSVLLLVLFLMAKGKASYNIVDTESESSSETSLVWDSEDEIESDSDSSSETSLVWDSVEEQVEEEFEPENEFEALVKGKVTKEEYLKNGFFKDKFWEFNPTIKKIRKNCLEVNPSWEKRDCLYTPISDSMYGKNYFQAPLQELSHLITKIHFALNNKVNTCQRLTNKLKAMYQLAQKDKDKLKVKLGTEIEYAENFKNKIVQMIQETLKKHELKDCQKACLIKCISSNLLEYWHLDHDIGRYVSIFDLIVDQRGVCSEFAKVAEYFGRSVGVKIRTAEGGAIGFKDEDSNYHMFNEFYIDGKWYIGEPQNSNCTFMEAESNFYLNTCRYLY